MILKIESFVRGATENFNFECNDGWGNENSMIMQGLGMLGKMRGNEHAKRVMSNLIAQISYDRKYAGIAGFYEMENGTVESRDRINGLMEELNKNFDAQDDEMALVFYTKYETKLGGKEHYQDVMNRYKAAAAKPEKNNAYFITAVIEGIESIDQAVYEYYDGLKKLFKEAMAQVLTEDMDMNDKALAAFALLKACRLKVVLAEKYEKIGLAWYEEVLSDINSKELNQGAALMLVAERLLH